MNVYEIREAAKRGDLAELTSERVPVVMVNYDEWPSIMTPDEARAWGQRLLEAANDAEADAETK